MQVVPPPERQRDMVTAESVQLVGNYALRLIWKDGHTAGIYEFVYLRSLAPLAEPEP
jgi:DUF971 family protein